MDIRDFCETMKPLDSVEGRYLLPFVKEFQLCTLDKRGERGIWYSVCRDGCVRTKRLQAGMGWFGVGFRTNGDLVAYKVEEHSDERGNITPLESSIVTDEQENKHRKIRKGFGDEYHGPRAGDLLLKNTGCCQLLGEPSRMVMAGTLPPLIVDADEMVEGSLLWAVLCFRDDVIYKGTLGDFALLCDALGLSGKQVLFDCVGFPVDFVSWNWADKRNMSGFFDKPELDAVREVVRERQALLHIELNEKLRERLAALRETN